MTLLISGILVGLKVDSMLCIFLLVCFICFLPGLAYNVQQTRGNFPMAQSGATCLRTDPSHPSATIGSFRAKCFEAQVAPVKPKRKVVAPEKTKPKKEPKGPNIVIKPTTDIAKEMEEYFQDDKYLLILFNDNFNKRAYVAAALQEVLGFSSEMSEAVMLQAHNNGFAVAGEWYKELCQEYAKRLTDKGIMAEAVKAKSGDGHEGGSV